MEFPLNYQELHEIDVTPEGSARTWARLAKGITGADPSNNEDVAQDKYLDGDGYGSSDVIGAQKTIGFSGHRIVGDTAQDYIASIQHALGDDRKSSYRFTDPFGNKYTKECTIASIEFGGGDAGSKTEISFEIHLNGKPTETPKAVASEISTVVAGGSAIGTTTATATAGDGNSLAYRLKGATAGTIYAGQYISGVIGYISGNDIVASAGQYLQVFELDANDRVVKFFEELLEAGDITSV